MSIDLDPTDFYQLLVKATSAACEGNVEGLTTVLSGPMGAYFENDPQGQLFRSAIQNHQKKTFDVAMARVPPLNATAAAHAMSAAIRHGFFYAAVPLLPFLKDKDGENCVVESVITKQQEFFDLLIHFVKNDQSIEEHFALVQYKHTHDLTQMYYQWKEYWRAKQQRESIVSNLDTYGKPYTARKI